MAWQGFEVLQHPDSLVPNHYWLVFKNLHHAFVSQGTPKLQSVKVEIVPNWKFSIGNRFVCIVVRVQD